MAKEILEAELASLSREEKLELVQRLTFDLAGTWPGIEKTPGVLGGDACIAGTRIAVWMIEGYRRLGWNDAKILANYPSLRAADLAHAWSYVAAHEDEIDEAMREHEAA